MNVYFNMYININYILIYIYIHICVYIYIYEITKVIDDAMIVILTYSDS